MLSEELLKRFKDGKVVFNCPTREVFGLVLDAIRKFGGLIVSDRIYWEYYRDLTVIECRDKRGISYGSIGCYIKNYPQPEIVKLSIEDFNGSSEVTSVTIVEPTGNPMMMSKVYTKAKVTKNTDGYTVEILPTPKFTIGDLFVISSGKLGKVISAPDYINGKYTYEIQWTDGKKNKCQPEDSMIKLEESFK